MVLGSNLNVLSLCFQVKTYLKNGQTAKSKLNRLISDAAWGELKDKVKSLTEKLGLHFLEINPKNTSRQCNCCGDIDPDNREGEKFLCVECGNFDDADLNAAKNILEKGLKFLNISHIQLPVVRGKVTGMDSKKETSFPLGDEPANPTEKSFKQLSLFELSQWSAR